jgi:hypothetical protein
MQSDYGKPFEYKPFKSKVFKKRLDKIEYLIKSIDETSLKNGDKKLLKKKIKELTDSLVS